MRDSARVASLSWLSARAHPKSNCIAAVVNQFRAQGLTASEEDLGKAGGEGPGCFAEELIPGPSQTTGRVARASLVAGTAASDAKTTRNVDNESSVRVLKSARKARSRLHSAARCGFSLVRTAPSTKRSTTARRQ